jgi:AcrR family transcriptional regulator
LARRKGQRDATYGDKRRLLLDKLRQRIAHKGAPRASWRDFAGAADIGLATLKHYFGKRDDIILAIMQDDLARGAEQIAILARPTGPFNTSIAAAVHHMAAGFTYGGVGRIYAVGLVEGLGHPVLGPSFVKTILEPGIAALETRLQFHIAAGEMRACDTRNAAIALLSPILVAFLHQSELDGADSHPLDLETFANDHIENFIRAYRQV